MKITFVCKKQVKLTDALRAVIEKKVSKLDKFFRDEAEAGIFELVKAGNRLKDYEIYLKRFPNGKYVEEAKAALKAASNEEPSAIEYQAPDYAEPEPQVEEEDTSAKKGKSKKGKKAPAKKKAKGKKR